MYVLECGNCLPSWEGICILFDLTSDAEYLVHYVPLRILIDFRSLGHAFVNRELRSMAADHAYYRKKIHLILVLFWSTFAHLSISNI